MARSTPLPDSDFSSLRAVFINCSLKKSSGDSHTRQLIEHAAEVMRRNRVDVDLIHALDHRIAFGMSPDMRKQGWDYDDWPKIFARIRAADMLVVATPIWLGTKSSVCTLLLERLYSNSSETNDKGQYVYYGKTAGCLVTGNEDGIKSVGRDVLYALQHIGFCIPPAADAGWVGEAGPGPSYGDEVDGQSAPVGYDNEFTNRNTTILIYNLMHLAKLLQQNGGFPVGGNVPEQWKAGERFGFPLAENGSPSQVRQDS